MQELVSNSAGAVSESLDSSQAAAGKKSFLPAMCKDGSAAVYEVHEMPRGDGDPYHGMVCGSHLPEALASVVALIAK